MKSTELRIGNLVDLGNRIGKVIDIGHLSCTVVDLEETQDTLEDYERTQGIPLTEEWLERFGFTKSNNVAITIEYKLDDLFSIWKKYGYNVFYISQYNENDTQLINTTQIKEVHQLQNLYFALTGKELKLN